MDWNSRAYFTVSGQNSNNSVRVDNAFMQSVERDGQWNLYWRTEKEKSRRDRRPPKPSKTLRARDLWDQIAYAAWSCADPGIQFDTSRKRDVDIWTFGVCAFRPLEVVPLVTVDAA